MVRRTAESLPSLSLILNHPVQHRPVRGHFRADRDIKIRERCSEQGPRLPLLPLLAAVLLLFVALAQGQVAPGTPSFVPTDNHGIDSVDLLNNNVMLNIPIYQKAGMPPLNLSLTGNYGMTEASSQWLPYSLYYYNTGLLGNVNGFLGGGFTSAVPTEVTSGIACPGGGTTTKYFGWVFYQQMLGTIHPLPTTVYTDITSSGTSCLSGSGFSAQTTDRTGFTVTVAANSVEPTSIYDKGGTLISSTPSYVKDSNGNEVSVGTYGDDQCCVIADSLGNASAVTFSSWSSGSFAWTDVNGHAQTASIASTASTVRTNFGCSNVTDYPATAQSLPTTVTLADNRTIGISYETTPGYSSDVTGRIYQLTLPESGTVKYTYGPASPNEGIDCHYQNTPVLTRTLGNGDVTTYTLTHSYGGSAWQAINAVVDPGGNETDYTFTGFTATGLSSTYIQVPTEVQKYQGNGSGKHLLTTDLYSYNTAFTSSPSATTISQAQVTLPVTEQVVYHQISGMSTWSTVATTYDAYGNVLSSANYDFGGSYPVRKVSVQYGSCTSQCNSATSAVISNAAMAANNIYNRPGAVLTQEGPSSTFVAEVNYTYDAYGNLLSRQVWKGPSTVTFIGQTTNNAYNTNGTPSKTYDLANNETDYTYLPSGYYDNCPSGLNPVFPTKITNVGTGLTTQASWDCTGGVQLSITDPNGNVNTLGYKNATGTADPYWRQSSVEDPLLNTAYTIYPTSSAPVSSGSSFEYNSSSSINASTITVDGYGRTVNTQTIQGVGSSNYDTVSTGYQWPSSGSGVNYFQVQASQPTSEALNGTSTLVHTSLYDPLGRLHTEVTSGNETVTSTYSQNDVLTVLTPAPSGENSKQLQTQYDGLGRVSMVCHIGSTASTGSGTACGQNTGSASGVTDAYIYGESSGGTSVSVMRAGVQVRADGYDAAGRFTGRTTPEGGTWSYYYDTAACTGARASPGNLTCVKDPNGNVSLYFYDALNRVTEVNANGTTCRYFVYDTNYGSLPTGVSTPTNTLGRLAEAYTTACTGSDITDEWFSYDKDGNMLNLYQSSPHSTQYYNAAATFYGNGAVDVLTLSSPSLFTMTYGLDGEGRTSAAKVNSTVMVYGTTFNAASQPTAVNLINSSSDNDAYTWDPDTGRMTGYSFTVGATPATLSAIVGWNQNGTLKSIATTDGFNSGGSVTCLSSASSSPGGYDDWNRLILFDCGSGNWGQTFGYDIYDNLSKAVITSPSHTGTTWDPGYSPSTNQFSGGTFDNNGNTQADGNGNYWGWNEFSKMAWYNTSSLAPTCGSAGKCATYDAFGRMIEQSNGTSWREYWFTQGGNVQMTGTTANFGSFPTAAGTVMITGNNGSQYYLHNDWLGNARITSTHARVIRLDQAYTPYGEIFANFGTAAGNLDVFAGTTSNFNTGTQWDTPNRSLAYFGRWLSPDPSGQGGQWNRYAYPTNPNSYVDPSGLNLFGGCDEADACGGGGGSPSGGDGGGFCDASGDCGPGNGVDGDIPGVNGVPWNFGPGYAGTVGWGVGAFNASLVAYLDSIPGYSNAQVIDGEAQVWIAWGGTTGGIYWDGNFLGGSSTDWGNWFDVGTAGIVSGSGVPGSITTTIGGGKRRGKPVQLVVAQCMDPDAFPGRPASIRGSWAPPEAIQPVLSDVLDISARGGGHCGQRPGYPAQQCFYQHVQGTTCSDIVCPGFSRTVNNSYDAFLDNFPVEVIGQSCIGMKY